MVQLTHNGLIFNDFGLYVPIIPIVCTMSPAKGHGIQEVSGLILLISITRPTFILEVGLSLISTLLCGILIVLKSVNFGGRREFGGEDPVF